MINQLKTDRLAQIMLIGVIIAAFFGCIGIGLYGYVLIDNPFQPKPTPFYPSIDVTPAAYTFHGDKPDIIQFSVANDQRVLFAAIHNGDGQFLVELTDDQNRPIKTLFSETGYFATYTAHPETLAAGNYYLYVSGSNWTISVGNQ